MTHAEAALWDQTAIVKNYNYLSAQVAAKNWLGVNLQAN
jgi:hypothetical protein